ncbi:VgrG family protein [Buttiauxella ferragutiae ATCC 51602]|uniref:VgrG family protein n=1 Tax=Buttiauxella ferragutiae ATCC 51602 TaxID=1354252 RepID=A0ABX2WBQ5_9ENTR|nr:VgrG family protein [Buttiauxella ferragutiae ATCC 51602]
MVIHPGGVDISGLKINLNSGGRPGDPVHTQLPAVLSALAGEGDAPVEPPQDGERSSGYGSGGGGSGNGEGPEEPDEPESEESGVWFFFS